MRRKPKNHSPNQLKGILQAHGITNLELAREANVSPSRTCHVMMGDKHPVTNETYDKNGQIQRAARYLILERMLSKD